MMVKLGHLMTESEFMKKYSFCLTAVLMLAAFTGCGSDSSSAVNETVIDSRALSNHQDKAANAGAAANADTAIYLRGEMNDYGVSETYRLHRTANGLFTLALLRSDWSPYKFKFADRSWSAGANYGYAEPPGVLRDGSAPVKINPNSRFEEISFHVKQDGVYRFCIVEKADGPYATVSQATADELESLHQSLKKQN